MIRAGQLTGVICVLVVTTGAKRNHQKHDTVIQRPEQNIAQRLAIVYR